MKLICSSADRPKWLEARKELFGASEVADLLLCGYVDPKLPLAEQDAKRLEARSLVCMRKAGLAEDFEGNEHTEFGQDYEACFPLRARRKLGWELQPFGWLVGDELCPRLGATPDFVMDTPWGKALVQTKVSWSAAHEDVKPKRDGSPSDSQFANGCPMRYQLQVITEMMCTGYRLGCVLVDHLSPRGTKLRAYRVDWHEGVANRIRSVANEWWLEVERMKRGEIR